MESKNSSDERLTETNNQPDESKDALFDNITDSIDLA